MVAIVGVASANLFGDGFGRLIPARAVMMVVSGGSSGNVAHVLRAVPVEEFHFACKTHTLRSMNDVVIQMSALTVLVEDANRLAAQVAGVGPHRVGEIGSRANIRPVRIRRRPAAHVTLDRFG